MASKQKIKICHLTSAHKRDDIRVFVKQCKSLAKIDDFSVALIVADNLGDTSIDQIDIYDVGKLNGRLNRFLKTSKNVYLKALELDYDIYQLHDPELIPYGLKLKKNGKKVIFDAHEDLPQQLRSKPYLNGILKKILPLIFERYEAYAFNRFDALLGATPFIAEKLKKINNQTININNYPIIGELDLESSWENKKNEISYIGAISQIRGVSQIVDAMQFVKSDVRLNLVGEFNEEALLEKIKKSKGYEKVKYHGLLDRKGVSKILSLSKIGIVTFLPVPNHINSQPNKMFEYMSTGIPIITSNFELWKQVVESNKCGITVNPLEPLKIAEAIDNLIENNNVAKEMGLNGKRAINSIYNWREEEKKLITLYQDLNK